jgi:Concanavalin A-like lectin/glucanases superfamily
LHDIRPKRCIFRANSYDLYIGLDPNAYFPFNGSLDDVRIYNRALSATEVKQLYSSGAVTIGHSNALISNGLVGYWTFDGGSIDWRTNTVRDMSGNGNTGSLISMSTTSSPTLGKSGQALNFGGAGRVQVLDSFVPTAYSISAWVNATSTVDQTFFCRTADDCTVTFSHMLGLEGGVFQHYTFGRLEK